MSKQKKCIFIASRDCPFKAPQIPFQTCQVCIEAWKTETAIKKRQAEGIQATAEALRKGVSLPIDDSGFAQGNMRLKEIDELLKRDEINPLEYIRLRREHINSLIEGTPAQDIEPEEVIAPPRAVRVAVISKSFFRKQIKTHPSDWELPKEVSGKVLDMIFELAEEKAAGEIRLRSGGYKIAGIAAEKNQLALMIIDADEEFESYEEEIQRVNMILKTEKSWADAMKKLVL